MNTLTYQVEETGSEWTVCEDEQPVGRRPSKAEALETAYLLAIVARAMGRPAELLARDTAGRIRPVNMDQPLAGLRAFY